MSVREETAVRVNAQNQVVSAAVGEKDKLTLELADKVDAGNSAVATLTEQRDDALRDKMAAEAKYEKHMADAHPVTPPPVTPPPTTSKRRTLHGLGGGNSVRTGIELDRRYYGPSDTTKMVRDTTNNEAKGIVSWNSFKFPHTWAEMAKGAGDDWFKAMMKAVSEGIKPVLDDPDDVDVVWVSGHHEPEGDQPDERLWRQTQERLSLLVPGGSEGPIKWWLTTTGWNQEFNTARVAALVDWGNLFPVNGDIYGLAYDAPYNTYGKIYDKNGGPTGEFNNKVTDPYVYVDAVATRAKQYGVEAALGEWGYGDEMFAKDPTWGPKVQQRCINNPIQQLLGETYFDTKLNSTHTWWLGAPDSAKRKAHMASIAALKGK